MATDVAKRARTDRPIRQGAAVVHTPGAGPASMPVPNGQYEEQADVTDADVARYGQTGRNRFYYSSGEADPPDPT